MLKNFLHIKKIVVFGLAIILTPACKAQATEPALPCEFVSELDLGGSAHCGILKVHENHQDPESPQINIAYVVIPARNTKSTAYPLIYLSGGPGSSTLSSWRINNWQSSTINETRDIILLDQRGVGYSSPLENINEALYEIMAKDAGVEAEYNMINSLVLDLKTRSENKGVQLELYNTFQNAQDIGKLMEYLGYDRYNLYGTSYGTRLARVVEELYPAMLNSVILNSPNPLIGDFLIDRLNSYSLSLERVLNYCLNDPRCNSKYPALRDEYTKVINSIKQSPLKITIKGRPFYLNAQDAIYFLRRKLYANNAKSTVPELIKEYKNGGGPIITGLIANEFGRGYNYTMWLSVERHEMISPDNNTDVITQTYQDLPLLPAKLGLFNSSYLAMPNLHDGQLSPNKKTLKKSLVPTVIMVNQYDPVTPPKNGYLMMETLSNAQLFILDEAGHGGGNVNCRNKVMIEFMDMPNSVLDVSCLNLYPSKN